VASQSDVQGLVDEAMNASESMHFKHEFGPAKTWAESYAKTDSPAANVAMGRVMSYASNALKRVREEASAGKDLTGKLATVNSELAEAQAEADRQRKRVTELEGLLTEKDAAAKALLDEAARKGMLEEKVNFSSQAARENVIDAPLSTVAATASAASSSGSSGASSSSAPASYAPNVVQDALFAHIMGSGNMGNGAFRPSKSTIDGQMASIENKFSAALAQNAY